VRGEFTQRRAKSRKSGGGANDAGEQALGALQADGREQGHL
jgi:hypothetical protein